MQLPPALSLTGVKEHFGGVASVMVKVLIWGSRISSNYNIKNSKLYSSD